MLARPWLIKVTERAGTDNVYCTKYGQFRDRFEGQCGLYSFGGRLEEECLDGTDSCPGAMEGAGDCLRAKGLAQEGRNGELKY